MPEHERELGEITATLSLLKDGQDEISQEFREYRGKSEDSRRRQYDAIQEVNTTISGLSGDHKELRATLIAHTDDDNRRFSLLWRVILGGILGGGGAGGVVFGVFKVLGG